MNSLPSIRYFADKALIRCYYYGCYNDPKYLMPVAIQNWRNSGKYKEEDFIWKPICDFCFSTKTWVPEVLGMEKLLYDQIH